MTLVTDRFAEYLKTLYLNEYPCHDRPFASSGQVRRSALAKRDISSINDLYEIEELLNLLKDKKSPWYEVIEWTKNGDYIRETYIKNKAKINITEIEKYFETLRLIDLQIVKIDCKLQSFVNLKELVLNCNLIKECDTSYLPDSLEIFDLTGNYLRDLSKLRKKPMRNLKHFGLGYNWIENLNGCFDPIYWPAIRSLDLQYNQFEDLIGLIQDVSKLSKLKVLTLLGNPVTLLPGYRGLIIDNFPNLIALDDKVISREERISFLDFKLYSESINKASEIQFHFLQLRNLVIPEQSEIEDGLPEIFLYKYLVKFNGIEDENDPIENECFKDYSQHGLHSMITYNNREWKKNCTYTLKQEATEEQDPSEHVIFNEKGIVKLRYKSLKQLRDFILDGTELQVIERKRYYQSKDYVPETTAEAAKKKTVAKPKEDKNANDTKKSKVNKKNNQSQLLTDNYNLISSDDKVLASFNMNVLAGVLDGSSKEVEQNFSIKLRNAENGRNGEVPSTAVSVMSRKSVASSSRSIQSKRFSITSSKSTIPKSSMKNGRKSSVKGKEKPSARGSKLNDIKQGKVIENDPEPVEALPLELDVKFKVLDFVDCQELRAYFETTEQQSDSITSSDP